VSAASETSSGIGEAPGAGEAGGHGGGEGEDGPHTGDGEGSEDSGLGEEIRAEAAGARGSNPALPAIPE